MKMGGDVLVVVGESECDFAFAQTVDWCQIHRDRPLGYMYEVMVEQHENKRDESRAMRAG
jgi:hypothetical protein